MTSQLTTITDLAELRELQKLHLKDWPKHCVPYYWLDNYMRWLKKEPHMKFIAFYTLDGNWQQDGLYLLHRYQLFFSNLSRHKTPELLTALNLLDWSRGYKVSAIHESHHGIYKQLVGEHRLLVMEREMKTLVYRLPCQQAQQLQVSCPAGYYLDDVRLEHAELVNGLWSARHPGSLKLIQLLIEHNTNVGLYEQVTGKLCAWCLRLQSGFLGALEVLQTHQRRGLGQVVAAAIAKRIASDLGHDVTALVNLNNVAACKVFDKLQFMLSGGEHYYWSMCLPTAGSCINWPDGM